MKGAEAILDKWDRLFEELRKVVDELIPELEKSSEEIKSQYAEISEELKEIRATFAELSGRVTQLELEKKAAPKPEIDEEIKKSVEELELEVSKLSKRLDSVERLIKDRIRQYDEKLKKVEEIASSGEVKKVEEIERRLEKLEEIERKIEEIERRLEKSEETEEKVEIDEIANRVAELLVERVAEKVQERLAESISAENLSEKVSESILSEITGKVENMLKMEISRIERELSELKSEVQVNRKRLSTLSDRFEEFIPLVEKKSSERRTDSKSPRLL